MGNMDNLCSKLKIHQDEKSLKILVQSDNQRFFFFFSETQVRSIYFLSYVRCAWLNPTPFQKVLHIYQVCFSWVALALKFANRKWPRPISI